MSKAMASDIQISAVDLSYAVSCRDQSLPVLRDVRFAAHTGEFIGIVGPNGAGKTTLLKSLAGFLPVQGEITISCGRTARNLFDYSARERARLLCYMHQDTVVPFAFSVREVVALGRHPWMGQFSSSSAEDMEKVDAALRLVGCDDLANRCILELSGGERQRVMLARALAQDTPVLLLDEPTASLDIRHAQWVFSLCRELAAQGRCIISVMHDIRQAAGACTRLCLLHEGAIIADGAPAQVLTASHIEQAYGVLTQVFDNPAGQWDYFINENGKS